MHLLLSLYMLLAEFCVGFSYLSKALSSCGLISFVKSCPFVWMPFDSKLPVRMPYVCHASRWSHPKYQVA